MNKDVITTNKNSKQLLKKIQTLVDVTKDIVESHNYTFIIQKYNMSVYDIDTTVEYFFSNSDKKTFKLFDIKTGLLVKEFNAPMNYPRMKTNGFSEILWDMNTGKLKEEYLNTSIIEFSANGKLIAYGKDNKVVLRLVKENRIIKIINKNLDNIQSIKFYNNDTIILFKLYKGAVEIWDIHTGKVIISFNYCIDFSDKYLLVVNSNITEIWDVENLLMNASIQEDLKDRTITTISKDNKFIMTYDNKNKNKNTTIIYSLETGEKLYELNHKLWIKALLLDSANLRLAIFDNKEEVRIVDIKTEKEIKILHLKKYSFFSSHFVSIHNQHSFFSDSGKFILDDNGYNIIKNIYDTESDKDLSDVNSLLYDVSSIVCSPDGTTMTSCHKNKIKIWDIQSGVLIHEYNWIVNSCITYSPCSKYIAVIQRDFYISIINLSTNIQKEIFIGEKVPFDMFIEHLSFDNTGNTIRFHYFYWQPEYDFVLECEMEIRYNEIGIINISDGSIKYNKLFRYSHERQKVSFSSNSSSILMGGYEKLILANPLNTKEFKCYGSIEYVMFSNDEKIAVTIESYGYLEYRYSVCIYNIATTEEVMKIQGTYEKINTITLSKNGKFLLIGYGCATRKSKAEGNENSVVELWDVQNNIILKTFKGHLNDITSVEFHPYEKHIITSSTDGMIKLWEIESGKEIYTIYSFKDDEWLSILSNNKFNSSNNGTKYIKLQTSSLRLKNLSNKISNLYNQQNNKLLNMIDSSSK